jgi:hypothetical protein
MISRVFANSGHQTKSSENDENKAGYFQPQLTENTQEVACSGFGGVQDGAISATAPHLLACNSRGNAQFPSCGDIRHCSRFYQPQGLK